MVNKKCARCQKTVYTIEELRCLDKIWHKQCFKCQECGMLLSMHTYKGFNRLPYCNAHIPHATYTTVLDTPEARRLAENTKLQSQVKYHEDYERSKGRVTQVADDPETMRLSQQSKLISDAAYHGEFDRKIKMDKKRNMMQLDERENGYESATYGDYGDQQRNPHHLRATSSSQRMPRSPQPPSAQVIPQAPRIDTNDYYEQVGGRSQTKLYDLYGGPINIAPKYQVDDSVFSFRPKFNAASLGDYEIYSPMGSLRRTKSHKQSTPSSYSIESQHQEVPQQRQHQIPPQSQPQRVQQVASPQPQAQTQSRVQLQQQESVDPAEPKPGQSQFAAALNALQRHAPPQSFGFQNSQTPQEAQAPQHQVQQQQAQQQQGHQQTQPCSPSQMPPQGQMYQRQMSQQSQASSMVQPRQQPSRSQAPQQVTSGGQFRPSQQHGRCFVALYDYMAGDVDEVTFCEGDVITNGKPIDGGWMTGIVLRNGQRGMLPSNYVQAV